MMRAPAAGRNWEGFGGDPYLSGEAAFQMITGIQSQGVQGQPNPVHQARLLLTRNTGTLLQRLRSTI